MPGQLLGDWKNVWGTRGFDEEQDQMDARLVQMGEGWFEAVLVVCRRMSTSFVVHIQLTYPSGWLTRETINSTAKEDARRDRPGRVTVHCWSSVRSFKDYNKISTSVKNMLQRIRAPYIFGTNNVMTEITSEPLDIFLVLSLLSQRLHSVAHDEKSVESKCRIHHNLVE